MSSNRSTPNVPLEYVKRLMLLIKSECDRLATPYANGKKPKGDNDVARAINTRLAAVGYDGSTVSGTTVNRWRRGVGVTKGLDDESLTRLGLYIGFSDQPLIARQQCDEWLRGRRELPEDFPPKVQPVSREVSGPAKQLPAVATHEEILINLSDHGIDDDGVIRVTMAFKVPSMQQKGVKMDRNPCADILQGLIDSGEYDQGSLCIALRVTGQRLSEILNGAMFTAEECSRAAEVVGIPVATLEDTGACRRHERQPVSNNHQGSHS